MLGSSIFGNSQESVVMALRRDAGLRGSGLVVPCMCFSAF